jgi:acetyl esterase/lipase
MKFLNERSALTLLNAAALAGPGPVAKDVRYALNVRHRLDVYAPKAASSAPVVVFFHGGSWETGAKEDDRFVAGALTQRGYVAIVPDYGLYPEVRYPGFLHDAAQAVAWTKVNAARYGGDPDRIFLLGHSAGAYNAAMLSLDRRWLEEAGLDPRRDLAGWIGLSGPYDFLPLRSAVLKAIFGPPEHWPQTQPITHATGEGPPALLATGQDDVVVHSGNSLRLGARLRTLGGAAEVVIYPNLSHKSIVVALARPLRFLGPVLDDVTRFVSRHARRDAHSEAV